MTPKEKAKELVERFGGYKTDTGFVVVNIERAKQCALICVDSSIESLWKVGHSFCNDEIKYLEEVKTEIEKI